jgi:hypothetical protein
MTAALPDLARVLDVQFWLMGRDVEHPDGNLLIRLGLTRQRVADRPWPSRYRRDEADGHVLIWPCGLFLQGAEAGCLLVRGRTPATVSGNRLADVYDLSDVEAAQRTGGTCTPAALARASQWFARYEAEVTAIAGVGHRRPRPGSAPALAPPEPCSLEPEWHALAERLSGDRLLGQFRPGLLRHHVRGVQSGQSGSAWPVRFSCSPWAASARRIASARSAAEPNEVAVASTRPARRVVTSCSSQPFPSGSRNVANEP